MKERLSRPRGAPDWLPPESRVHEIVVARAVDIFLRYGYQPIQTPAFEVTELFARGLSESSDVVTKEMYTFEDRGGQSLTLRPDMTAPVVRAVLENGLDGGPMPIKLYYHVPVFRRERPQAGRFRQFDQVGVEVLGRQGPYIDVEVIDLAFAVYEEMGIEVDLSLNSIGHADCRARYMPKLVEFLESHRSDLCEDCQRKIGTNPLRTFDCKVDSDQRVLAEAPVITDHLCPECKEHYEDVKRLLDGLGHRYEENPRLVRGLDYYTRTTFEFTSKGLGSQDAVGGGGRYDGLSEVLGGPPLAGIGFGLGVARIAMSMQAANFELEPDAGVFIVSVGDASKGEALTLASTIRKKGISADLDLEGGSIKSQFRAADRRRAKWTVVIGDREIAEGVFTLRNMESGDERKVSSSELFEAIGALK